MVDDAFSFGFWPYAVLAFVAIWAYARGRSRTARLPPGPPGLPFVGNVLDVPKTHLGREFRALSEKYGSDLIHLSVLGQSLIVLNSWDVACELLEKRSAIYSDRPPSIMAKLTGYDWAFLIMRYGQEWRHHRRIFHQWFHSETIAGYQPLQLQETRTLLRRMRDKPDDLFHHIELAFGSVVMRSIYGLEISDKDNKYLVALEKVVAIFAEAFTPGRWAVEAFPILRHLPPWFPGGGFKKVASGWHKEVHAVRDGLYNEATKAIANDSSNASILAQLLAHNTTDDPVEAEKAEEVFKSVAAITYIGGADTTNAAVKAFMLAMVLHPDVQKKAQAELDAVVGPNRLPDFDDRPSLPYVTAVMREVLRWHVITPIGTPHCSIEDDVYNGYLIPKGSLMVYNIWAYSRDETQYSNPEAFDPERFLLPDGKLNPNIRIPLSFSFGFGRRICPGRHFAEASLFMTIASVLHVFNLRPPVDANGNTEPFGPKISFGALMSVMEPFRCSIKPRSPEVEALITASNL